MYNKVITSQYFLWYLTLAPLALVNSRLTSGEKWKHGVLLAIGFIAFELFWLWPAYYFEFEGEHKFKNIQFGSYCWFWYHLVALY
jgi:GPI mannosyltransferase 1 subunit M